MCDESVEEMNEFMIQYVGSFNQLDFFNVCVFSFHTHGKSTVTEHVGEVQASISEETTSKEQGSPLEMFDFHGFSEAFACACVVATGFLR